MTIRVTARLARPEFLAAFQRPEPAVADTAQVRRELADAQAQLVEYELSASTPGGVPAEMFARIAARLTARIAELEGRLAPPRPVSPLLTRIATPDAATVWDRLGVGERRRVLREVCTQIVVLPATRRGVRGFDPGRVQIGFADEPEAGERGSDGGG